MNNVSRKKRSHFILPTGEIGKTCPSCGESKSLDNFTSRTATGQVQSYCKKCMAIRDAEYRRNNSELLRARVKRYRQAHPERVREQGRRNNLKRYYNLTEEDYDELLVKQGGVCAVCGTNNPGGRGRYFHIDHDHFHCPVGARSCGQCIRGLLCHTCNTGQLGDNPELLRRKADYIEKFRVNNPQLWKVSK